MAKCAPLAAIALVLLLSSCLLSSAAVVRSKPAFTIRKAKVEAAVEEKPAVVAAGVTSDDDEDGPIHVFRAADGQLVEEKETLTDVANTQEKPQGVRRKSVGALLDDLYDSEVAVKSAGGASDAGLHSASNHQTSNRVTVTAGVGRRGRVLRFN